MHPELLDQLALDFLASGWDVKAFVKRMVLSRTYRQSSIPSAEALERDPLNQLHSRQGRWRLPAEFVRDTTLSISGTLVQELGGPSVKPPQPPGYYGHLNFPPRSYNAGSERAAMAPRRLRSSAASVPPPDARRVRCSDAGGVHRSSSRLEHADRCVTMLNDPIVIEASRGFAERILRAPGESGRGAYHVRVA